MIAQMTGILLGKEPPLLIETAMGIVYEIDTSSNTLCKLPEIGQTVKLYTHFIVREDAQLLFGFFDLEERSLFRILIKVNGVGPKLAMTILSSMTPDDFIRLIMDSDTTSLTRVPGIGKKTAERLMIEMRDKLKHWEQKSNRTLPLSVEQEAVRALIVLGFKPQEVSRAMLQVRQNEVTDLTSEALIRQALQNMRK